MRGVVQANRQLRELDETVRHELREMIDSLKDIVDAVVDQMDGIMDKMQELEEAQFRPKPAKRQNKRVIKDDDDDNYSV